MALLPSNRVIILGRRIFVADKEQPAYLGHRDRVRQRIAEFGFNNLTESDLLEYLLFFAIPRCDTYSLSRTLIKEFGNLRGVLNANLDELCEIKGIGRESALFLTSFIPVFKAYHAGKASFKAFRYFDIFESSGYGSKKRNLCCSIFRP